MDARSEEELLAVKEFWSNYGKTILAGIIIAVVFFFAFNFYKDYKASTSEEISALFSEFMEGDKTESKIDEVLLKMQKIDKSNFYTQSVILAKSKLLLEQKNYSALENLLKEIINKPSTDEMQAVATLGLASAYIENEQIQKAESLLSVTIQGFEPLQLEMQADVALKQNNTEKAISLYKEALESAKSLGNFDYKFITMKLQNLGINAE